MLGREKEKYMRLLSRVSGAALAAFFLVLPASAQENSSPATARSVKKEPPVPKIQLARSLDDFRERVLLDRLDQLERRLTELEARTAALVPPQSASATAASNTSQPSPGPSAPSSVAPTPSSGAPAQEATSATSPNWSAGPIDFSGLVDFYYMYNANHPLSQSNQLYNFDVKANQFSLNMAKLSLAHSPDPVGFQVDFGFGRAFDMIHSGEPNTAPGIFRNIEQAYVSLKPAQWHGFEADLGEFVTSAGAEVIESHSNWNYSRSLLFSWAIPYYHFGLRTSFPVGKHFTGGFQIVNGWNNIEDNNSGKTLGFTGAFSNTKFVWYNNYYTGPENPGTNVGWRSLYDTTLLLTPSAKLNAYLNFDYGQNASGAGVSRFTAKWYGVAGALHYQVNSRWAFTPRVEWFKDRDGFSTGLPQDLKEFTLTAEYKMVEGVLGRLEYRHDWSNRPFFDRGVTPASCKSQDAVALGIIGYFGPRR
jgi:hypothetical protein